MTPEAAASYAWTACKKLDDDGWWLTRSSQCRPGVAPGADMEL